MVFTGLGKDSQILTSNDPYHITHTNEELPPEPDVIELTGNTLEVSNSYLVKQLNSFLHRFLDGVLNTTPVVTRWRVQKILMTKCIINDICD